MDFENKQLYDGQMPAFEEVEFQPLNFRYNKMLLINSILELIILALCITAFVLINTGLGSCFKPLLFYSAAMIWFIFRLILINHRYKSKGFAFRQKDVLYKSGIIFRNVAVVPFKRIQHCRITEGFIQRFYSLSTLHVYTAGGNALTIPGLAREDATRFRLFIMGQTIDE